MNITAETVARFCIAGLRAGLVRSAPVRVASGLFSGLYLLAGLGASAAMAQGFTYVSGEGHQYRYERNENGAVLTSLYPVARFTGFGAMTRIETGTEVLYLGRDCDAYSKVLGEGNWSWANGGFVVEFDNHRIGFPRQEIEAGQDLNCRM